MSDKINAIGLGVITRSMINASASLRDVDIEIARKHFEIEHAVIDWMNIPIITSETLNYYHRQQLIADSKAGRRGIYRRDE